MNAFRLGLACASLLDQIVVGSANLLTSTLYFLLSFETNHFCLARKLTSLLSPNKYCQDLTPLRARALSCSEAMAILEDVEVKVILNRTGQPLVEYANPDPEAIIEAREVEKYIEAEIGAEFSIQVTLKAGFNFHLANGVNVYINIDGGTFKRYAFQRKPRHLALMSGKLLHDLVITRSTSESQHGQVSYSASYAFGSAVVGLFPVAPLLLQHN